MATECDAFLPESILEGVELHVGEAVIFIANGSVDLDTAVCHYVGDGSFEVMAKLVGGPEIVLKHVTNVAPGEINRRWDLHLGFGDETYIADARAVCKMKTGEILVLGEDKEPKGRLGVWQVWGVGVSFDGAEIGPMGG